MFHFMPLVLPPAILKPLARHLRAATPEALLAWGALMGGKRLPANLIGEGDGTANPQPAPPRRIEEARIFDYIEPPPPGRL